jgi:hypothetical protein
MAVKVDSSGIVFVGELQAGLEGEEEVVEFVHRGHLLEEEHVVLGGWLTFVETAEEVDLHVVRFHRIGGIIGAFDHLLQPPPELLVLPNKVANHIRLESQIAPLHNLTLIGLNPDLPKLLVERLLIDIITVGILHPAYAEQVAQAGPDVLASYDVVGGAVGAVGGFVGAGGRYGVDAGVCG